jgi:hypothetical protein
VVERHERRQVGVGAEAFVKEFGVDVAICVIFGSTRIRAQGTALWYSEYVRGAQKLMKFVGGVSVHQNANSGTAAYQRRAS